MTSVCGSAALFLAFLSLEFTHSSHSYAETPRFLERNVRGTTAVQGSYLSSSPTRAKIDLEGPWTYVLENGEAGTVHVPDVFDFVGKVEYTRSFDIGAQDLDRFQYQIVCYGINYSCDVSINGEFLGNHAGGSTSFAMPVPSEILQSGKDNTLRLLVSNELDGRSTLPIRPLAWGARNYGGIHRDIYLLATPKVFIHDVTVECALGSDPILPARVSVTPVVEGKDAALLARGTVGFAVEVVEAVSGLPVGHSTVVPLEYRNEAWVAGKAEITIPAPRAWTPETPDVYLLKCQLLLLNGKSSEVIDDYRLPYGLRSLDVKNGDIHLNGKRLILRAVSWYEDHPSWGSAIPYEDRERDIVLIKNLGANAIRFVGHAPDPFMLDLCDRYGLLAMEDLPLANSPAVLLSGEAYQELAVTMLREMIQRDRNHPSVLGWGIGDEIECQPHRGAALVQRLLETVRAMDGRPTYRAVRLGVPDSCAGLTDIEIVDVYVQELKQFRRALEEWRAERPNIVLLARIGTEVAHGNLKGYNDPLSQQAQARFFLQRLEVLRTLDFDGAVIWSFNDWRGDRPALTVHTGDPWMHTMGLVNDHRERRLAYDAVRSAFRGEKPAALPAGSYTPRAPIIYVLVGFVALILVAYFYNANRRFREHINRSVLNAYNFFADVRDQHSVSVVHTTLLAFLVSVSTAIVLSSVLLHFRDSLFLDNLLSYLLVSDDLKAVVVRLIWDPLRFIGALTLLMFILLILSAGVVHQLRLLMKSRVFAFHAYTATIWSTTPLLAFIPIGMILYRVMEGTVYIASALIIIALFMIWVVLRLLKAVAIVYDVFPPKIYAAGLLVIAVLGGVGYLYFDLVQSAPMYLSYLFTMVGAGR